jgi:hypothetical protein
MMMQEIQVLSETEIEVYSTPDKKVKQKVITYLAPGLAPRTLWIDSDKLPDAAWQKANPGKPVPADIQAKGDAVRRAAIEADIKMRSQAPQPRKI